MVRLSELSFLCSGLQILFCFQYKAHVKVYLTKLPTQVIFKLLSVIYFQASGDDGISHKMLRGVSKSVSKPLCILMNRSLEEGIIPDIWKIANVIPIFKKGDKSQPSNYRPVALLRYIHATKRFKTS